MSNKTHFNNLFRGLIWICYILLATLWNSTTAISLLLSHLYVAEISIFPKFENFPPRFWGFWNSFPKILDSKKCEYFLKNFELLNFVREAIICNFLHNFLIFGERILDGSSHYQNIFPQMFHFSKSFFMNLGEKGKISIPV